METGRRPAPVLARFNRAGLVTVNSQPGEDVDGLLDDAFGPRGHQLMDRSSWPARVCAPRRTRRPWSAERKRSKRRGESDSTRPGLTAPPTCCSVPWQERRDPRFEEKLIDVVGLYLNPPEDAVVLCMDEKTSAQALDAPRRPCP